MHEDRAGQRTVVSRKPYEPPRAVEVATPVGVTEAAPDASGVFSF